MTNFGAKFNEGKIEFSLCAPDATDVQLCIFEVAQGAGPVQEIAMRGENGVWRAFCEAKEIIYYGYRVFGPNWEKADDFIAGENAGAGFKARYDKENCFRFNPNKLAVDPYSFEWSHNPDSAPDAGVFYNDEKNYMRDSAPDAPKSVFRMRPQLEASKVKTRRALCDEAFVAEVHLKDLTWLWDSCPVPRGTFEAAAAFAKNLKATGVTMVEFLPLNEFNTDPECNCDLKNYWGYMPLGFFALKKSYSAGPDPLLEFQNMIKAFHQEDIKVCMDVVYNHDGEAGHLCEDDANVKYYSFTPIADKHYHRVLENGRYRDNTGCGADFNLVSTLGQNIVADSIAFFAKLGVNAFRLDLAAAFMDVSQGTEPIKYEPHGANLAVKLAEMLEQRGVKVDAPNENTGGINLLAEPWNCGLMEDNSQYQAGNFPENWAEWSDIGREFIRKYTFENVSQQELKNYLEGHPAKFLGNKLPVNYVSSHDGHCLYDLNTRYFKPWSDVVIETPEYKRLGQIKMQIALVLLSRGVAMLQLGDIIIHSKKGMSNPYNQDNEINYLNWSNATDAGFEPLDTEAGHICAFVRGLAEFRKKHPEIGRRTAYDGVQYFESPENTLLMCVNRVFIALSCAQTPMPVVLPLDKKWHRVCDSADETLKVHPEGQADETTEFILAPKSVSVFVSGKPHN
jgi:glycogen operon protein